MSVESALRGYEVSTLQRTRYGYWEGSFALPSLLPSPFLDIRDREVLLMVEEESGPGVGKAQRNALDILVRDLNDMLVSAVTELTRTMRPELRELCADRPLRLDSIHVLGISVAQIACIGLDFHSAWDAHLGAGALFHGGDLLTVGKADVSLLRWIAVEQLTLRGMLS